MREVNDKAHYRPATIQVEVNSMFAPLAGLLDWNTSSGRGGTTSPGGCR